MEGMAEQKEILCSEDFARFCRRHRVEVAVLFGSRAKGTCSPDSDWDLAFQVPPPEDDLELSQIKRAMVREICTLLKTSRVDVVLLNRASPLLRYQVAINGEPVFEKESDSFASFASYAVRSYSDGWVFREAEKRYLKEVGHSNG